MARYALMDGDTVANVILWDGETPYPPEAVAVPDDVGIGWTRDGDTWTAPPAPVVDVPSSYSPDLAAAVDQFVTMGLTEDAARAVARYDGPLTNPDAL